MTDPARRVERALARARHLRDEGRIEEASDAIAHACDAAASLDAGHPLIQVTAWRRAKIEHDLGRMPEAMRALQDVLDDPNPFEHYPRGRAACETLARRYWDRTGYGSPLLRQLWRRFSETWAASGDPYRAEAGRVQLLWDLACAGDLTEAMDEAMHIARLDPTAFAGAPSQHPRARSPEASVSWLQLDAGRTLVRAATWAKDAHVGARGTELMEDAAEEIGLHRDAEHWFLEPMALFRSRLGRSDPEGYLQRWLDLAPRLVHPRAAFHHALAEAEAERIRGGTNRFVNAATAAGSAGVGSEWEIDAWIEANATAILWGQSPDPDWLHRAAARAAEHGVGVFGGPLARLRSSG